MGRLSRSLDEQRQRVTPVVIHANGGGLAGIEGLSELFPAGYAYMDNSNMQAVEYYKHNRGWANAAIRVLGRRISSQPSYVARRLKPGQKPRRLSGHKSVVLRSGEFRGQRVTLGDARWFRNVLPMHLKDFSAEMELIDNHPLSLAMEDPNEIMVQSDLTNNTVANLEITGKCYWWVYFDEVLNKMRMWPMPTHWIEPRHSRGLFSSFIIRPTGTPLRLEVPPEMIVYFKIPDPGDLFGALGTMQAQAKPVAADDAIAECQYRGFHQGIHPGMAIVAGKMGNSNSPNASGGRVVLDKDQRNAILDHFIRRYSSPNKYNLPVIIDGFIEDIRPITNTMREMDFLNSGKYSKERVVQGFGVSAAGMGQVENANRASSAVSDEHMCRNAVNPLITTISQTVTKWMGPVFEAKGEDLVWFIEEAHGTDPEFDFNRSQKMFADGAITFNSYRQANGERPVRGGDVFLVRTPLGVIPIPEIIEGEQAPNPADISDVWGEVMGTDDVQAGDLGDDEASPTTVEVNVGPAPKDYFCVSKTLAREDRKAFWIKAHGKVETSFFRKLKGHFNGVASRFIDAFRNGDGVDKILSSGKEESRERLRETIRPHLKSIAEYGAGLVWDLHRPRGQARDVAVAAKHLSLSLRASKLPKEVRDAVNEFTEDILDEGFWRDVSDRQREQIARIIRVGVKTGLSHEDIAARLELEIPLLDADRAMNIARTESTGAINAGAAAVRDKLAADGLLKGKEWISVMDAHVREAHFGADGQVVANDDMFLVGGEHCLYPGDVALSPANRCGCRCVAEPVFKSTRKDLALFWRLYGPQRKAA